MRRARLKSPNTLKPLIYMSLLKKLFNNLWLNLPFPPQTGEERGPKDVQKFGVRIRIHTKATTPLYDLGMNFGVRYAYDSAQCEGPWNCNLNYEKFGYLVLSVLSSGFGDLLDIYIYTGGR